MSSTRCDGIDDPSIINDASNVYDTFERPIRVINIKKTLEEKKGIYFIKPQDWNFHVLSHTWSTAVRKFSKDIGNVIKAFTNQDEDAYNLAFEKESFSKDPTCYNKLLEIFEMLHEDGVKLLWFDALCINQTSENEKSYEINNMGSYFSLSIGTYVLTQGVGKKNGICTEHTSDGDSSNLPADLPRWFTRVWTFQEFLLPKQLSFLVEGSIDQKFVAMVNCLIQEKQRIGLCKCFLKMQNEELDEIFMRSFKEEDLMWIGGFELRNPKWKSIAQLMEERAPLECTHSDTNDDQTWNVGPTLYRYKDVCKKCDTKTDKKYQRDILHKKTQRNAKIIHPDHPKGESIWDIKSFEYGKSITCSNATCKECGSRPMIRQAMHKDGHKEMTYFVDREVFLGLMQCHSRMVEKAPQDKLIATEGIQALRGLYCAWETEGNWRPCHVICEVAWRACKEEEDRVLAILGLLGLRLKQLRTNKSLKEQVLELAKAGGSAMLVELCVMNQKGGSLPHMSWAPHFHGLNHKLEYASRPRSVSMHIDCLEPNGQLKVKVKMACGRVEPYDTNPTKDSQGSQYRLIIQSHIYDDEDPTIENSNTKLCFSLTRQKDFLENSTSGDQEHKSRNILRFYFNQDVSTQLCGAFEVPINNDHQLDGEVSLSVRLLLLGIDEIGRNLFLICIPDKTSSHESNSYEKLHKIGSLSAVENMSTILQSTFDSSKMHPCVIGSFGEDLIEYIQIGKTEKEDVVTWH